MPASRRVLILIPTAPHLLDIAGPAQVFTNASEQGAKYYLDYVAEQPQMRTHQGIVLNASTHWPQLTPHDILGVPGWKTEETTHPFSTSVLQRKGWATSLKEESPNPK